MTQERKEKLEQYFGEKLPRCSDEWEEFKALLQEAAEHIFDKKMQSSEWFDDQDKQIKELLENKRLNRNKFRECIRSLKNRWFQEKAEETK